MNTLFSYDFESFQDLKVIPASVKVVCGITSWCLAEDTRLTFHGDLGSSVGGNGDVREIEVPDGVQDVKAGKYFYAYTTKKQDLYVIGTFESGSQTQQYSEPKRIIHDTKIDRKIIITTGANHVVAVYAKSAKTATCAAFGANNVGQLGTGKFDPFNSFKVQTDPVSRAYAVGDGTFKISGTQKVYAHGRNDFGQLGVKSAPSVATKTEVKIKEVVGVSGTDACTFFSLKNGDIYGAGRVQNVLQDAVKTINPRKTIFENGSKITGGQDIILLTDRDRDLSYWVDDGSQRNPIYIAKGVISSSCSSASAPILFIGKLTEVSGSIGGDTKDLPDNIDPDLISTIRATTKMDFVVRDGAGDYISDERDIDVNVALIPPMLKITSLKDSNRYQIALALIRKGIKNVNVTEGGLALKIVSPDLTVVDINLKLPADIAEQFKQNIDSTIGSTLIHSSGTQIIVPPTEWFVTKIADEFAKGLRDPTQRVPSLVKHDEQVLYSVFFRHFLNFPTGQVDLDPSVRVFPRDEQSAVLASTGRVGEWQDANLDFLSKHLALTSTRAKWEGGQIITHHTRGIFRFGLKVRDVEIDSAEMYSALKKSYVRWQLFVRKRSNLSSLRVTKSHLGEFRENATRFKILPFEGVNPKRAMCYTLLRNAAWAGKFERMLVEPLNDAARRLVVKVPLLGNNWYVPSKFYYDVQFDANSRSFENGAVTTIDKKGNEYIFKVGYSTGQDVKAQTKQMFEEESKGILDILGDDTLAVLSKTTSSMNERLLSITRMFMPDIVADAIHEELMKVAPVVRDYIQWMSHISANVSPPFTVNGEKADMLQRLIENGYTTTTKLVRDLSQASMVPELIGTLYADEDPAAPIQDVRAKMMDRIREKADHVYGDAIGRLTHDPTSRVKTFRSHLSNIDIIVPVRLNRKVAYVDEIGDLYVFDLAELKQIMSGSDTPVNPNSGMYFSKAFVENYKEVDNPRSDTLSGDVDKDTGHIVDVVGLSNRAYALFLELMGEQEPKESCEVCYKTISDASDMIITECGGSAKKVCSLECMENMKCKIQPQKPAIDWFPDVDFDDDSYVVDTAPLKVEKNASNIYVFGTGVAGQLGLGDTISELEKPTKLQANIIATQVACGGMHTIALTDRKTVYSWGCEDCGTLGREGQASFPQKVKGLQNIVALSVGDGHSTALDDEGTLYMWGSFRDSKGIIETVGNRPVAAVTGVAKAVSSENSVTILDVNGNVYAKGSGEVGQLGQNQDRSSSKEFLKIEFPEIVSDIFSGGSCIFAKTVSDNVYAWGSNNYKQLGVGGESVVSRPVLVKKLSKIGVTTIACGEHHTLICDSRGRVYSCGRSDYGRLGRSKLSQSTKSELIEVIPTLSDIVYVACSASSFALRSDGKLFAWGFADGFRLGIPHDDEDKYVPTLVNKNKPVKYVSSGGQHGAILIASEGEENELPQITTAEVQNLGFVEMLVNYGVSEQDAKNISETEKLELYERDNDMLIVTDRGEFLVGGDQRRSILKHIQENLWKLASLRSVKHESNTVVDSYKDVNIGDGLEELWLKNVNELNIDRWGVGEGLRVYRRGDLDIDRGYEDPDFWVQVDPFDEFKKLDYIYIRAGTPQSVPKRPKIKTSIKNPTTRTPAFLKSREKTQKMIKELIEIFKDPKNEEHIVPKDSVKVQTLVEKIFKIPACLKDKAKFAKSKSYDCSIEKLRDLLKLWTGGLNMTFYNNSALYMERLIRWHQLTTSDLLREAMHNSDVEQVIPKEVEYWGYLNMEFYGDIAGIARFFEYAVNDIKPLSESALKRLEVNKEFCEKCGEEGQRRYDAGLTEDVEYGPNIRSCAACKDLISDATHTEEEKIRYAYMALMSKIEW